MTVVVDGRTMTLGRLVRVARRGDVVELSWEARDGMLRSRAVAESVFERGEPAYGLTTGYGVQKRMHVDPASVAAFNRRQLHDHAVGQGPYAPTDVVRAAMLLLVNLFAGATTCVRPELGDLLVDALNERRTPAVRTQGSIGASDLAPMADLAEALTADIELAAGEGLALLNNASFSTAWAALALHDARELLDAADAAAALALEGFAANLSILHPIVQERRPHPALVETAGRFRDLLEGSYLWQSGAARNLQDPLTFRSSVAVQAAARTALGHALDVLAIELNAAQGNPLVVADESRILSAAAYEVLPLAAAVDYVRVSLASALTAASERAIKLLDTPWSGLPTGLAPDSDGSPDLGLSIHAIAAESLATEAALLAQPVSFALVSTSGAEGIEDRATMLPLSARRLSDMVSLGQGVVAIELLVAAQAVELRGAAPLGAGSAAALRAVRSRVPFMAAGDAVPSDATGIRELVASGALAAACGIDC